MSYTQSPWTAHFREYGCLYTIESPEDGGYDVANVYSKPDAQLIAAAPELLEACKAMAKYSVNDGSPWQTEFEMIRKAIAKAEGK